MIARGFQGNKFISSKPGGQKMLPAATAKKAIHVYIHESSVESKQNRVSSNSQAGLEIMWRQREEELSKNQKIFPLESVVVHTSPPKEFVRSNLV